MPSGTLGWTANLEQHGSPPSVHFLLSKLEKDYQWGLLLTSPYSLVGPRVTQWMGEPGERNWDNAV